MSNFPSEQVSLKRKPDTDDQDPVTPDPVVVVAVVSDLPLRVDPAVVPSRHSCNAPRQSWLAPSSSASDIWRPPRPPPHHHHHHHHQTGSSSSHSPLNGHDVSYPTRSSDHPSISIPYDACPGRAKRPRLENTPASPSIRPSLRRSPRRHLSSSSPVTIASSLPTFFSSRRHRRLGGDIIQDTGVVSRRNPGPTTGSLLRVSKSLSAPEPTTQSLSAALPLVPINPNSPHIPSPQPLINRQTLKELDLEAILRNPQLRHDLLFDAGLQFRPTSSRRKREMSENYWAAITRELETGCTCVSFDPQGKPHDLVCACGQVSLPTVNPILAYSSSLHVLTLRMPSRIRPLLSEFLEVLLSVIQPLSSLSGMYVNPNTFHSQMQEHASQAAYMRSVFDPDLIEQELRHELFDPSGLFQSIGQTLKSHCAPMRDRAVEAMVTVAQSCSPGGKGTKADAVRAVRMCMDILELMKLDIANHQLQTLRPFLVRTSGQFELKTFRARKRSGISLDITQDWLRKAHRNLLACDYPIPHPQAPLNYRKLQQNQQAYLATLRALTDLVFEPPSPISLSAVESPPPTAQSQSGNGQNVISALAGYPETSYLDNARLLVLSTYAADATNLYMFLMLYRQLIYSDLGGQPHATHPKIEDSELIRLKKEVRDIGGCCLTREKSSESVDVGRSKQQDGVVGSRDEDKWRIAKRDIILQIAMRANEARQVQVSKAPSQFSDERPLPIGYAPDEKMLKVAEQWSETNMQPSSALYVLLRNRLRDVVFETVVAQAYPPRDSSMSGKLSAIDFGSQSISASGGSGVGAGLRGETVPGTASGMEPLSEEIQSLAERLSRLALIHLNAYLPLYEQANFLES